jgi:integrase
LERRQPLHQSNIGTTLRRHLGGAGIPRIRFHALCHTHAALLISADVNPKSIQDAMRHASIRRTLDTYGHMIRAKQTERLAELTESMDAARERIDPELSAGPDTDRISEHNESS